MDILYSLNDKYVCHMAASLCSLCEHNEKAQEITFHIISCGITDESKEQITDLASRYQRAVAFYEIGDVRKKLDAQIDTKGFDVSVLSRLFVGSCLPETVEKVLYLDCDTIIVDDLAPLFETDFGNSILAGCAEPVVTKSRRPILSMPENADYYNSGVLLFNLPLWRKENCEKTVLTYFLSHQDIIVATDQDALNACFYDRILTLPPKYNYGSYHIYYPYRLLKKLSGQAPYVTKEVYDESKAHPAIIHYLGEERPWRKGNTHPYRKEYKTYLSKTQWADTPDETGWGLYFFCFRIFNFVTKPFPSLRYRIIDSLIPAFQRRRAKKIKKENAQKDRLSS
jgi:lipopolysaccharide biosynthesis glycosyltransferase